MQAESFSAVATAERSLSRDVSDALQMVAAIESGSFTGGERDPLDCDSFSDDGEGGIDQRPSTGSVRTRPKSSGQTELPLEVRCVHAWLRADVCARAYTAHTHICTHTFEISVSMRIALLSSTTHFTRRASNVTRHIVTRHTSRHTSHVTKVHAVDQLLREAGGVTAVRNNSQPRRSRLTLPQGWDSRDHDRYMPASRYTIVLTSHSRRFLRVRSQCSNELYVPLCIQWPLVCILLLLRLSHDSILTSLTCAVLLLACTRHRIDEVATIAHCTSHIACNDSLFQTHEGWLTHTRFLLVDRVAAELPHMSRAEIEEHEDW